jgi:hypothetical protein
MGLWPRPKQRRRKPPPAPPLQGESPFAEEGSLVRQQRNEAAMALVDDDTYAYVLVRLVKDDDGQGCIEVKGHVREQWRAPFQATLRRIVEHGLPTDA